MREGGLQFTTSTGCMIDRRRSLSLPCGLGSLERLGAARAAGVARYFPQDPPWGFDGAGGRHVGGWARFNGAGGVGVLRDLYSGTVARGLSEGVLDVLHWRR